MPVWAAVTWSESEIRLNYVLQEHDLHQVTTRYVKAKRTCQV